MKPAGDACLKCPGLNAVCVPPEPAKGKTRLAIVGEAPGRNEVERGRPFIGASGRLLMKGMRHLDLKRDNVHWTNAVLCDVSHKDLTAARKCCAQRLRDELNTSKASVIMPVGAHGLRSTLGHRKNTPIMKWRGSVQALGTDHSEPYVCPTIHPAFAMRQPKWMPILELDVERVGRVMRDGWKPPEALNNRRFVYALDKQKVQDCLRDLQNGDIGFDVETVGLGATHTRLVCYALSDGDLTVMIPQTKDAAGLHDWWNRPQAIADLVSNKLAQCVAITHNGPIFDHIVAERYGIYIDQWEDTLQASHAFESQLPRGLGRVASTWLDINAWKEVPHTDDIQKLWYYNCQDTLYTVLTWREMKGQVT